MGEGNGTPLQYSCLENPMDGGAWWAAVHGVSRSRTWLSDVTFTFHFPALEKEMATHSSVLAWRIPGMGEPGGLPSMSRTRLCVYAAQSRTRLRRLSSSIALVNCWMLLVLSNFPTYISLWILYKTFKYSPRLFILDRKYDISRFISCYDVQFYNII